MSRRSTSGVGQFANQLLAERLEALVHRGQHGLVGLALLDPLVDALLDEDALQRAEMQFVLELGFLELQLALERLHQLGGVLAQHLGHGHLDRPVVPDDDDAAGDGDFAIGEGIERIHQLLRADAAGRLDLDLHLLRREIVDALDLDLALVRGVLDGADQRIGRGRGRDFLDDDRGLVLDLDLGADLDLAGAVLVAARVHEAAGLEVGQALEGLLLEDGDLRFQQLGEVVRQDARGHAHGDAFGAEHQQQRQLAGQGDRLLVAPVVAGHEVGDLVVEHLVARQLGQAALDVARRGGEVAREDVAEIALAFDEVALVGQHHQRVADRGVAVRMILHRVADDVGDLDEAAVVLLVQAPRGCGAAPASGRPPGWGWRGRG